MSVSEAMCKVTASEFVEWQERLARGVHEFHRDDWNFAQLAYRLYCIEHRLANLLAKHHESNTVSMKEFLLKFKDDTLREAERAEEEVLKARYAEMSEEECLEDPVYREAYDQQIDNAKILAAYLGMDPSFLDGEG